MQISIDDLYGETILVNLSDVGAVYEDDDVIYFNQVPCKLSSARPEVHTEYFIPGKLKEILNSILDICYGRDLDDERYRGCWVGSVPISKDPKFLHLINELFDYA